MSFSLCILSVSITLKNGSVLRTTAYEVGVTAPRNALERVRMIGGRGLPTYVRLDEIVAIECRKILNWRRGFMA